jgi:TRAP-type C4-dicarboxylate transport system permease small subunit
MKALERGIVLTCQAVLWITTAAIFAILCANTVLRYTSGGSLQWASELPELLFPWMVMAGVVLAAEHGSHITTSFLMEKLPSGARRVVAFVVWLAVAGLYATLARATWNMLDIVADEKSPILQVPGSATYGCVMAGMAMLAVLALLSAWRVLRGQPAANPHGDAAHAVPDVHVA